jgi:ATP-dependent DNA helicase RecG
MVEAWGRGMPLIIKNAPDVVFREVGRLFIVSFNRPSFSTELTGEENHQSKPAALDRTTQEKLPIGEKVGEKLTLNQEAIAREIIKDPRISAKALAAIVGISSRKVEENIKKLREQGRLIRIGPAKGGHW